VPYPDPWGLDSTHMAEDGGVLENLPRSRPGRRSAKRTTTTSAKAATRAERSGAKAAKPSAGESGARSTGGRSAPPGVEPLAPEPSDPVGDALRLATSIAATGARVANGVARELLRRLPRP
jgi:hypothetical protein